MNQHITPEKLELLKQKHHSQKTAESLIKLADVCRQLALVVSSLDDRIKKLENNTTTTGSVNNEKPKT